MASLSESLDAIEAQLESGRYEPGPWGRFVREASLLPDAERKAISGRVSAVSDALHRLRHETILPLSGGLALEVGLSAVALALVSDGASRASVWTAAIGALLLATALQPLVKVAAGALLGVRYSYAYLLNFEPRFKMRFGTYLSLPVWRRAAVHGAGTLGSPLGWAVAAVLVGSTLPGLSGVLWVVAALHFLAQVPIFALAVTGIDLGPLTRLTSAGAAAREVRRALDSPAVRDPA